MSAGSGVGVHPENGGIGEPLVQLLLHLLGPGAHVLHDAAADGAGIAGALGVAAVVTHEPPVGGVIRQRHAAPGTFRHIAALAA